MGSFLGPVSIAPESASIHCAPLPLPEGRPSIRHGRLDHQRASLSGKLTDEGEPLVRSLGQLQDPAIRLAGVGERLALAELDFEQPFAPACLRQSDRAALAVVEDVGRLMNDEISEAFLAGKVRHRDVAGRLLTQADDRVLGTAERLGTDAPEIEIGNLPGRTEPGRFGDDALDVFGRHKHQRALEHPKDGLAFFLRKEARHHGRKLPAGERRGIEIAKFRRRRHPRSSVADLGDQGRLQLRRSTPGAFEEVTVPTIEVRIMPTCRQVVCGGHTMAGDLARLGS